MDEYRWIGVRGNPDASAENEEGHWAATPRRHQKIPKVHGRPRKSRGRHRSFCSLRLLTLSQQVRQNPRPDRDVRQYPASDGPLLPLSPGPTPPARPGKYDGHEFAAVE